jgi:hypothetical protein
VQSRVDGHTRRRAAEDAGHVPINDVLAVAMGEETAARVRDAHRLVEYLLWRDGEASMGKEIASM